MKIMKTILKSLVKLLCKFASLVWSYNQSLRYKRFITYIHTLWISPQFKVIGNSVSIKYPIELRGAKYISIGSSVVIGRRVVLTAWDKYKDDSFSPIIQIGDNCSIGDDCHITAINSIIIGRDVLLGKKITITDNSHGESRLDLFDLTPLDRPLYSKGPVVIESGVWIGDKATILPNVTIGRNSIIGANSVVSKDVPANSIVGGVPAIVIKQL